MNLLIRVYESLWVFILAGFVGWLGEVIYAAYIERRFVNRGFLNGPFCPIYGVGLVAIDLLLSSIANHPLLLFFGAMVIGSTVEWIAGFLLEKLFKQKWWDYSDKKFQLNGYICLSFSIFWGVCGMVVVWIAMPFLKNLIWLIPERIGWILLVILSSVLLVDFMITLVFVAKLNKRLESLEIVSKKIRELSDSLGVALADGVLSAMDRYEESDFKLKMDEQSEKSRQELEALKKKMNRLTQRNPVLSRVFRAFPYMKSTRHEKALEKLQVRYREKRAKKKAHKGGGET